MVDYSSYCAFLKGICDSGDLSGFKSNGNYNGILEHLNPEYGGDYIEYIKSYTDITDDMIREFCHLNDSIGNPATTDYEFVKASPSNMRYIFHSHIILRHLQSLNMPKIDIVEVGGGYGGLCLALHHFSKSYNIQVNSYTIIDLKEPSNLQRIYLSRLMPEIKVDCIDACTFGKEIDKREMFLISNYCFSEISDEYQKEYITHLFPKVSHGFMAWNFIKTYDFGFKMHIEKERPCTAGEYNKYVYF